MLEDKVELRALDVDINPQYEENMEMDTFTILLAFEKTFVSTEEGEPGITRRKSLTQMHPLDADKDHMLPKYNNPGIEGFEAGLNEVGICLSD
jgi:hypothetical protein